jgi:2-oxoisovalerate dehydrogenase E1 component alpha subunit
VQAKTTAVEAVQQASRTAESGGAGVPGTAVLAGLRAVAGDPDAVQLLSPEGERVDHPRFSLDPTAEELQGLYRDMVLVRRFDREGNALQRQGQLGLWVPLLGQEAAQIGSGRALQPRDAAFPSYREHGVAWCRGVDPTQLLSLFRGTEHCGWDARATGFWPYTIVIGNQVLNATGYAMGQRLDGVLGAAPDLDGPDGPGGADGEGAGGSGATIVYFGDGATSQGDVHEAMVFAASFDAPVVFFCQNNQWAISHPVERQSRVPLFQRASGYGIPGIRVDGNDVLACLAVTRWALQECRSGNGPVMIEAFTYRMDAHTTSDDPSRYRLADEQEAWKLLDPIERVRVHLSRTGQADHDFFDEVDREADELAARFRAHCSTLTDPPLERLYSHVFAQPTEQLDRQLADDRRFLGLDDPPGEPEGSGGTRHSGAAGTGGAAPIQGGRR